MNSMINNIIDSINITIRSILFKRDNYYFYCLLSIVNGFELNMKLFKSENNIPNFFIKGFSFIYIKYNSLIITLIYQFVSDIKFFIPLKIFQI